MVHECDCGARYSNLDAPMACQNANHGRRAARTHTPTRRAMGGYEGCYHEDHEIDLEGRLYCNDCSHVEWATNAEIEAFCNEYLVYGRALRRHLRQKRRRELWMRLVRRPLARVLSPFWPRLADKVHDDEIPF
jgi:hypothetical protein